MFSPQGPSARELCVQAFSSVERGYDLLAPKFDRTPFRTSDRILAATAQALSALGPFGRGLDLCCGTGAGLGVLAAVCRGPVTGVDFSAGMLAQARDAHPAAGYVRADARALPFAAGFDLAVSLGALGHFLPAERPALFAGLHRVLNPGGLFALPLGEPPPVTSPGRWMLAGFDLVMRVRNAVWRPQFVMYYGTTPIAAVAADLTGAGFETTIADLPVAASALEGGRGVRLLLARKPR